ncbi:site-specific integrase [Thermodesulfobacteriota bacterium]
MTTYNFKRIFFPDNGKGHLKDVRTAYKSALDRAGIDDFRIHDLRHTFASHFVMKGGSLTTLQKILGHADIKMTMRYAHLSKEFAREEIQLMNGLTSQTKKAIDEDSTAQNPTCHKTVTKSHPVTAVNQ